MSGSAQWLIVGVAVLIALTFVVRKYFPKTVRNGRQRLAIALLRDHPTGWRLALGNKIAVRNVNDAKHCDDCNGCD